MAKLDAAAGHAFISYVREDAGRVDELQERLERAGVRVWRDIADLFPGQDWRAAIRRAISDDSLVFIACFSQNSASRAKSYQNEEMALAIEQIRLRPPDVPWLIPVRFDDCQIPDWDIGAGRTLASVQGADLFGARHDMEADRLVVAVQQILGKPRGALTGGGKGSPWPDRKLDAKDIDSLNPRESAKRLAQVRLDDQAGLDDAVRALLGADSVSAAAEALEVLVEIDEAKAVALLAHMRRSKAEELIAAIPSPPEWLKELPAAADAINRCAGSYSRHLGQPVKPMARAARSARGTEGFYRNYEKGQIHWTARVGAQPMWGQIRRRFRALGGSGSRIGFPLAAEQKAAESSFGTKGAFQRFESRRDYDREICDGIGLSFGATIYWSAEHAHVTWGRTGEYYEREGGTWSWLGFPVSDEAAIKSSPRRDGSRTEGWFQRFEGGVVYHSDKIGSVGVHSRIADHHEHHGGASGRLGFPVSRQLDAAPSPYQTGGHFQRFEGSYDYDEDILAYWSEYELPGGATIYTSDAHGTYCVGWGNGALYEPLGGTRSWLGFPRSDEVDGRALPDDPWCSIQEFEGGMIFFKEEHGSVMVPRATMDYLAERPSVMQQLGFPIARPPKSPPDAPIQFFENGVVTNRDGLIEAWVRPEG